MSQASEAGDGQWPVPGAARRRLEEGAETPPTAEGRATTPAYLAAPGNGPEGGGSPRRQKSWRTTIAYMAPAGA